MIKAIASNRGWKHNSPTALYGVVSKLVKETSDDGIRNRFTTANALHQNFYENWGDGDYVGRGLAHIRQLLDTLEPLLAQPQVDKQRDG